MDKVILDAVEAKQKGMTYGQLIAIRYEQGLKSNEGKQETVPEGWIKCEYCGKPFKKRYVKRFCDVYCRERSYVERQAAKKSQKDLGDE